MYICFSLYTCINISFGHILRSGTTRRAQAYLLVMLNHPAKSKAILHAHKHSGKVIFSHDNGHVMDSYPHLGNKNNLKKSPTPLKEHKDQRRLTSITFLELN